MYICSGEKDAINVASMGKNIVCFNSETQTIPRDFVKKYSKNYHLVNIPDTDATGKKMAAENALAHWDLETIYLPYMGKYAKDLTDWMNKTDPENLADYFANLVNRSKAARFWYWEGKNGDQLKISKTALDYFVSLLGFRFVEDNERTLSEDANYVKITDGTYDFVNARTIFRAVISELEKRNLTAIMDKLTGSRMLTNAGLITLKSVNLKHFSNSEKRKTYFALVKIMENHARKNRNRSATATGGKKTND